MFWGGSYLSSRTCFWGSNTQQISMSGHIWQVAETGLLEISLPRKLEECILGILGNISSKGKKDLAHSDRVAVKMNTAPCLLIGFVSYSSPRYDSWLGPNRAQGRKEYELLVKNLCRFFTSKHMCHEQLCLLCLGIPPSADARREKPPSHLDIWTTCLWYSRAHRFPTGVQIHCLEALSGWWTHHLSRLSSEHL